MVGSLPRILQKPQGLCLRLGICSADSARVQGSRLLGTQKVRRPGSFSRNEAAGWENRPTQKKSLTKNNCWRERCLTASFLQPSFSLATYKDLKLVNL